VRLAFTLERQVIHGGGPALESPRGVVREAERHLRALLRDVLCGYLEPDLRRVADEILAATAYESELDAELRVHDARAVASPS